MLDKKQTPIGGILTTMSNHACDVGHSLEIAKVIRKVDLVKQGMTK